MARSGIAAARVLTRLGAIVTVTDVKPEAELGSVLAGLQGLKLPKIFGCQPEVSPAKYEMLVVSPGIPLTIPPIKAAYQQGIEVIGELELAYRLSPAPMAAITGTNGKTTTTALLGQILRDAGREALVGGNIGTPLVEDVLNLTGQEIVVAEVSSFQLETAPTFRPRVAAIINLTPDHLDRHGTMENYLLTKTNIFANQTTEEVTVLNYDDPALRGVADRCPGRVIFTSQREKLSTGVFVDGDWMVARLNGQVKPVLPVGEIAIKGKHNLENALVAVAAALALEVPPDALARTLRSFPGVEHRLEFVAEINGVRYINDSKGTNPDASIKALEAYDLPLVLIAGGKNKGSDFTEFARKIKEKAKSLVLVGQAANDIRRAVKKTGFGNIHQAATFPETVKIAAAQALPGDVVLLSPACASWDMFNNFEERGNLFKELVWRLKG